MLIMEKLENTKKSIKKRMTTDLVSYELILTANFR